MTLKDDRYRYRVTWSEEDEEYVDLCAEFPKLCVLFILGIRMPGIHLCSPVGI